MLSVLCAAPLRAAIVIPLMLARRKPGYSHLHHTISELAEVGSPMAAAAAAGFVAIGVLTFVCLLALFRAEQRPPVEALWMLSMIGIGYLGATVFPCDGGAPLLGSLRNTLHNIAGAAQYLGGAAGFWVLANESARPGGDVWASLALVTLASATVMSLVSRYRGLLQRLAESTLFGGLALLGLPL